jgi:hypothetical protein
MSIAKNFTSDGPLLKGKIIAVMKGSDDIKLLTWPQLATMLGDQRGEGQQHAVQESVNTRRPDQFNLVLLGFGDVGGYYNTRFACKMVAIPTAK